MYKPIDNLQHSFLDFNQTMGLHMNPDNRWIKMADRIPCDEFEMKYNDTSTEDTNKGTLTLDATCAPANIRYPQENYLSWWITGFNPNIQNVRTAKDLKLKCTADFSNVSQDLRKAYIKLGKKYRKYWKVNDNKNTAKFNW